VDATANQWNGLLERARAAESSGALDAALHAYEAALQLLPDLHTPERAAELMRSIGSLHKRRGNLDLAAEAFETSLAIADAAHLQLQTAAALNCLALVAQARAQGDEAETLYAEAKYIADHTGDDRLAASIDQNLGLLANARGDVEIAILNFRSALGRFRKLNEAGASAIALNHLGMAYGELNDWETAEGCFDEAFDLADSLHDMPLLNTIELKRAGLYLRRRDFLRARDCCDRAFEISKRLSAANLQGEAYKFYGLLYREMQRPGLADAHFQHALDIALQEGNRQLEAEVESEWAVVELESGRNREALLRLNRAYRLFEVQAATDLPDLGKRLDKLENTYLRVVQQWADSIESKDRYTVGHCTRLVQYAGKLAEAVGFAGRELTWLRVGSYLHDVGKTEVPAEVLNKPGKLTPQEWAIMQRHTTAGDEIVAELNFPVDIRPIVRSHHERWDGAGYPDRLSGAQIPLTARILCVADAFDALTTARSYRPALSREEALRIMERDAGKMFDPDLFSTFKWLISSSINAAA
jgi:putative nucleotidyltransferase with HDIG domain